MFIFRTRASLHLVPLVDLHADRTKGEEEPRLGIGWLVIRLRLITDLGAVPKSEFDGLDLLLLPAV